jgi:hypothetical protein
MLVLRENDGQTAFSPTRFRGNEAASNQRPRRARFLSVNTQRFFLSVKRCFT